MRSTATERTPSADSVLLCVDVSYQSYRNSAAHPMLTSRRVFTGGLYGFIVGWAAAMRETRATHVAFCLDSKPYKRSEAYPEYKLLRKKNADEDLLKMHKQTMALLREVLEECGLSFWSAQGFESDDLVAHACGHYRHRFSRIYAMSNDSDLYQLLGTGNFFVYRTDMKNLVGLESLRTMFGQPISPADYMLMTALTGTHNDIAGIPKVGPVTALKAIKDPALMRKWVESHGDIIKRNLDLIRLPHPEFPAGIRLPEHGGSFNPRQLYRSLGRYDIDVTSSMVKAFEQLLRR